MSILWQLFISFVKIGLVGYGGGPAMIPLIQEEVVDIHHWMNMTEFVDTVALGNTLPGPIAPKICAFVGYKLAGWGGAFVGAISVVLPSFLLMVLLGIIFLQVKDDPRVAGALKAVRPVVVALFFVVIYSFWPKSITNASTFLIGVAAFVATVFLNIHPAWIIVAAAVLGAFIY